MRLVELPFNDRNEYAMSTTTQPTPPATQTHKVNEVKIYSHSVSRHRPIKESECEHDCDAQPYPHSGRNDGHARESADQLLLGSLVLANFVRRTTDLAGDHSWNARKFRARCDVTGGFHRQQ